MHCRTSGFCSTLVTAFVTSRVGIGRDGSPAPRVGSGGGGGDGSPGGAGDSGCSAAPGGGAVMGVPPLGTVAAVAAGAALVDIPSHLAQIVLNHAVQAFLGDTGKPDRKLNQLAQERPTR